MVETRTCAFTKAAARVAKDLLLSEEEKGAAVAVVVVIVAEATGSRREAPS